MSARRAYFLSNVDNKFFLRCLVVIVCVLSYMPVTVFGQSAAADATSGRKPPIDLCAPLSNLKTYQGAGDDEYVMMVAGYDNWLYRSKLDLKSRFKLTHRSKLFYSRLDDALKRDGTNLVITMIPPRGMLAAKHLPPQRSLYNANFVEKNYLTLLNDFRETGIMMSDMTNVRQVDGYFLPDDNHWTAIGAKFSAERTADIIKSLSVYPSLAKTDFTTSFIEGPVAPPHRYTEFINRICKSNLPVVQPKGRYETVETNADKSENDLFGETRTPEVVLVGTSNSSHPEPSFANFSGFLKEFTKTDLINLAISGGSAEGSIQNFVMTGKYRQLKPKILVWELSAYYGYNNFDFLREIIPAIYGDCTAADALQTATGSVTPGNTEIFKNLKEHGYKNNSYYLSLNFEDKKIRHIKITFTHGDKKNSVKLNRPLRAFPENPGLYFAELSDLTDVPLNDIMIETANGEGKFTAKICQAPSDIKNKPLQAVVKISADEPAQKELANQPSVFEELKHWLHAPTVGLGYNVSATTTKHVNDPPELPDISHFTKTNLVAKIPALRPSEIVIDKMAGAPPLRKYAFDKRLLEFQKIQGRQEPLAIHIKSGVTSLEDIVKQLHNSDVIEETNDAFLLKLPIAVYPESTLIIKQLTKPLRMLQERGAFIASAGDMFVVDSTIEGWNGSKNSLAQLEKNNRNFRPFITMWDGSELYMVNAVINNLGYALSKSYGISISTNDIVREAYEPLFGDLNSPTSWILDSKFSNMYFGFYSYEAADDVILRNSYKDSVIYGIDPHDRSGRLIIGHNTITGSKKKHGIIISREVNNSFIFNNDTSHNHGSGIMLDRNCINTLVANNTATQNEGDGITLYESPHNTLYNNIVVRNGSSGIRVRNSWDIKIAGGSNSLNKSHAFTIYEDDLKHTKRDFELDPVTPVATVAISGVKLLNNGGVLKVDGLHALSLDDMSLDNASTTRHMFGGDLEPLNERIIKMMQTAPGIDIRRKGLSADYAPEEIMGSRRDAILGEIAPAAGGKPPTTNDLKTQKQ